MVCENCGEDVTELFHECYEPDEDAEFEIWRDLNDDMEGSEMIVSALSVLGMLSIIALVSLFTIAYDAESTGNSAVMLYLGAKILVFDTETTGTNMLTKSFNWMGLDESKGSVDSMQSFKCM